MALSSCEGITSTRTAADYCATALASVYTSAGIGRWSFQIIAIGFDPVWFM